MTVMIWDWERNNWFYEIKARFLEQRTISNLLSPANFSQPLNNNNNESEEQEEDRNVQFYADDGLLCGPEGPELQRALDFFATSFESLGLKMNAKKTEYMVMTGGVSNVYMSNKARVRKNTGVGETYNVRAVQKVTCDLCGKTGVPSLSTKTPNQKVLCG